MLPSLYMSVVNFTNGGLFTTGGVISFGLPLLTDLVSRVKKLQEDPYTQKEADAAIGLRTDNTGLYAKVTTQDGNDMETSE